MIEPGDRLPEARVALSPNETATLPELAAEGTTLFVFYVFDWSST